MILRSATAPRAWPAAAMALSSHLAHLMLASSVGGASGIIKEAVAHIQCEVCGEAVAAAAAYLAENGIADEDGVTDVVENLCSVKKKEGRWVAKFDIVREDEDAQLTLSRQEDLGECRSECSTVQRACTAALDGMEEKFVEMLMKREKKPKDMKKKLCKKACSKDVPKLGKKWKDEAFIARSHKDVEAEDLMEKMKAETGLGMKMYNREDLLSMSEGDMEVMAAREALASERAAAKFADAEL
mmetsp:Transcript_101030/g.290752  ORF Transcript_101030/g.290752 Transcript_101030/m.290752 type:complete len:242 (-) Transcript_101030:46-771(-)